MTVHLQRHLDLLGMRVVDRVTGAKGVVTSVGFDLYGCIQAVVNFGLDKDGKPSESHWYDVSRLEVLSDVPVMPRPQFEWTQETVSAGRKGPAERPAFLKP